MTNWDLLRPYLPAEWIAALARLAPPLQDSIQELRLRAEQPVGVSLPMGEWYLCHSGLTALQQPDVFVCRRRQLERCFLLFCEDSVYAHEWELRQGYIAVPGGIRVGVAGTAVTAAGEIRSVQAVSALCVRLPRQISGCAAGLLDLVVPDGHPVSTLLVGEPSSGKTTLLRDLAAGLAARHRRVAVVDERGELAGVQGLSGCDVLRGYPKAVGIRQAVRCLAPDVILFDELGDEEEAQAVAACAHAGVAVVATLHGRCPAELAGQRLPQTLVQQQTFSRWVFLAGRRNPGVWQGCYAPEVHRDGIHWIPVDRGVRSGTRSILFPTTTAAGRISAADWASVAGATAADDLYRPTYGPAVVAVGGE